MMARRLESQPAPRTNPRLSRLAGTAEPTPSGRRRTDESMTMKSVDLPHLRSVVLAGHAGAGKTTLAEQLLFRAGAIPRLGRVDDATAHLDYEPEEQKRRASVTPAGGTPQERRNWNRL